MEHHPFLAVSHALSVGVDALSVVAFLASVTVLVATGTRPSMARLAPARLICAALTGALVITSLGDLIARWALVLSCLGFLLSVQAIALAFGYLAPLQSCLDGRTTIGDERWWSEFEQSFWRYTARRGRRRRRRRRREPGGAVRKTDETLDRSEP